MWKDGDNFPATVTTCGCAWVRHPDYGDVVIFQCEEHGPKPDDIDGEVLIQNAETVESFLSSDKDD